MKDRLRVVIVALSLRLTRRQSAQSRLPTEEDLAALFDGTLSSERRKKVLSALVSNPEAYAEWMEFVESAEYLGIEPATAEMPALKKHNEIKSFWYTVLDNAKSALASYSVYSGLAIAALLLLFVRLDTNVSPTSELYEKFSIHGAPSPHLPIKAMTPSGKQTSLEQLLIQQGYHEGLKELGLVDAISEIESVSIEAQAAASNIGQKNVELFKEVGRWKAISEMYCIGRGSPRFFAQAHKVMRDIGFSIEESAGEYARTVPEKLQQLAAEENSQKEQVCDFVRFLR